MSRIFIFSRKPLLLAGGLALAGSLALAISGQAATAGNNWSPTPAPAQAKDSTAPTYIDTPASGGGVWGNGTDQGSVYAPDDLDARLSGRAPTTPAVPLQQPQALPPLSPLTPGVAINPALLAPEASVQARNIPGRGYLPRRVSPYGAANPYRAVPPYGGATPYGVPYSGLPYGGLPYGGAPGITPYGSTTGLGPFGGGLPSQGFPFFGFSPFGFW